MLLGMFSRWYDGLLERDKLLGVICLGYDGLLGMMPSFGYIGTEI